MHLEGEEFISIHDFVEVMCQHDKNVSFTSILNEFCTLFTSKYSYDGNKCFKGEASDKTRHILFRLDLVLEIFLLECIKKTIKIEFFDSKLNEILKKDYLITGITCCCCPIKLKKVVARVSAFTDFVRQGDAELRRFNSLKPSIKFLMCLDIEGKSLFCHVFKFYKLMSILLINCLNLVYPYTICSGKLPRIRI